MKTFFARLHFGKQQFIMLILVGVLLLVVVWPVPDSSGHTTKTANETAQTVDDESLTSYVDNMEVRLKNILEKIDGAGSVQVMITAKASSEQIVEKDQTVQSATDSENHSEVTVYGGGTNGEPYVVKELEPEIEGVLVVAQGAGNEKIAGEITYAVQVLFDVPIHKIKVVKMTSK